MFKFERLTNKEQFIESQIWSLSIAGAFQRGCIYKNPALNDKQKEKFKCELKSIIDSQINQWDSIDSEKYIALLKETKNKINRMIEQNGYSTGVKPLRFGTLQKLVNLYLKYQWCLGWRSEPPHCPFDGEILNKLKVEDLWTESDCVCHYRRWVEEAQKESKGTSIAQWELEVWNTYLKDRNG